jgi:hypothetical protein
MYQRPSVAFESGDIRPSDERGRTVERRGARVSRAARDGALDLEKDVGELCRAIAEIEIALRRAETEIEADARDQIRMLREDSKEQLGRLYGHYLEAKRLVAQLATAREGSSDDMQRAARRAVREARRIADAMIARCRRAIPD